MKIYTRKLKLPDSWTSLPIHKEDLEQVVCQLSNEIENCENLTEWAQTVEKTVDLAIQKEFQKTPEVSLFPKLPKRFKGRCQPRNFKLCPTPAVVKKAWQGHYNPSVDAVSISFKRMVRQLRRITSLKARIQKMLTFQEIWHKTWFEVNQEWKVILNADFDGEKFFNWIYHMPELQPFHAELPSWEWLNDCEQLVRHAVQRREAMEKKYIKDMAKIRHETDVKVGHKVATFCQVKGKDFPPFQKISNTVEDRGIIVPTDQTCKWYIYVDQPQRFKTNHRIDIDDQKAIVTAIGVENIYVEFADHINFDHEEVKIQQKIVETDIKDIFRALTEYWMQFWGRDANASENQQLDDEYFIHLLNSFPSHIQVPQFDDGKIDDWIAAIKKSKSHSAPGIDGITFSELKMLPIVLVKKLAKIVTELESFPEWLMKAKTVPIPKTDQLPTVAESRPITVLSTIYRIWSRVSSTQVLQYLGSVLPADITGMLPGRGAQNATYHFQVLLETSKFLKKHVSGITLDLKKCFNLIHRGKVFKLLEVFGIPQKILQKWYRSLKKLTRFWMINKQCSEEFPTYTGCPEGDSWSVICMICIALFWTNGIHSVSPSASASAYADNWSWWSTNDSDLDLTLQHTCQFVRYLGLEIDWNKTWKWTTASIISKEFQDAITKHVPMGNIDTLNHAWDLGAPITYKGLARHVKIQKRFENIKKRLQRIVHAPWSLDTKVHIINSAIYSAAFYASELLCIGQSHLDAIRSLVANALVGDFSRSMNPAFVLHCAHRKLVDPHMQVILLAIKSARRYLHSCDEDSKRNFLEIAATPSRLVGQSRGPASALREYILRLGWVIAKNGDIQVGAFQKVNLFIDPLKRIAHFAMMSWQENLVVLHSSRYKIYGTLPFSRIDTIQALSTFADHEKILLIREIAGAFQTKVQQNKWDVTTQDICTWCEQEKDTRKHRILFCSKFNDVRIPHKKIVQQLIEDESLLPDFPIHQQYQHAEFITKLHFAFPEAIFSNRILDVLNNLPNKFCVYTDGSCMHQNQISVRYAAYAIVVDWAQDDQQREYEANLFLKTGILPKTLQVIAKARVTGEQNIARAELYAIVLCFESLSNFTLFSDSAYAISCFEKIQQQQPSSKWLDASDFDLMCRLQKVFKNENDVQKIKAHTDICKISNPVSRYHALGNKLANDEAIQTCKTMEPTVVQELQQCYTDAVRKKAELIDIYRLVLDLQAARAQRQQYLQTNDEADNDAPVGSQHTLWHALESWHVCSEWQFPIAYNGEALKFSAYGFSFADAVVAFFKQCQWPNDEIGPQGCLTMGWAWTEVLLGIAMTFGGWPPVRRIINDSETFIQPWNHQEAQSLGITLAELTAQTVWYVKHVAALVDKDIFPKEIQQGKVSSLYLMGNPIWTTGFRRRPSFPGQSKVIRILKQWFTQYDNLQADDLPDLDQGQLILSEFDQQTSIVWQSRINKARSTMKIVAAKRKRG